MHQMPCHKEARLMLILKRDRFGPQATAVARWRIDRLKSRTGYRWHQGICERKVVLDARLPPAGCSAGPRGQML